MSMIAKSLHKAVTLATATPVAIVLEDQLDTENLLNPRVYVWNTSAQDIVITSLVFNLDLGANDYSLTLMSSVTVPAGAKQDLTLMNDTCMINRSSDPRLRHTLTLTYTDPGGTPSVDVRYIIAGAFDADPSGAIMFRDIT